MLNLIQSNRMQVLVDTLCANQQHLSNPFEPTTVVVQSFGIGQWLKVELAEKTGIAANIDCILPAELIWRLYRLVLPDNLPEASPFARQLMTWRIMELLPDTESPAFEQVQHYLQHDADDQLRLYQFSHVVAGLFDQYLIYRPDWIANWESGQDDPDQPWQSQLWRALIDQPGMESKQHRASLHTAFLNRLQGETPANLPNQISVLGISSLPGMHMQTLQALAAHIDISIYFLNPCEHYWGDIVSEKESSKRSIRRLIHPAGALSEEDYLEVGNPLLSSMGKQGREFFELLLETDGIHSSEYFQPAEANNALALIHNDILNLEFGGVFYESEIANPTQRRRDPADRSIQIHSCHSRMREIEVLLDQIYGMLDGRFSTEKLKPSDIIVMAPDIGLYAPYIEAVFKRLLPFSITDRPVKQESSVLVAFDRLLRLPDARLTASEVMDFLEIPAIANRFGLGESDLSRLLEWIQQTGIRFELDGTAKKNVWGLPAVEYNTWRFGLDRLLLGLAMEPQVGVFEGVSPYAISSSDTELVGKLCKVIDLLADYRARLSTPCLAVEWLGTINEMITDFLKPEQEEEFALNQLREALVTLVDETHASEFDKPIAPRLLRHWLNEQLEQSPQNRGFVSGGITFATLVPMRSIPYEAVCLIGMNDQAFPRQDKPVSFDLMAKDFRKGDRSRRNDDRYLFLEALLSARSIFYASYEGKSLKDNKPRPASVLLGELSEYLQRIYADDFITEHPLQPFNPIYYTASDKQLLSYQDSWYQALNKHTPVVPFVDARLPNDEEHLLTELDQLTSFFRNPAKYFLQHRLGVSLTDEADELKDTESFELDGLDTYQLSDSALETLLRNGDMDQWLQTRLASGLVMPGDLGKMQIASELAKAENIAEAVKSLTGDEVAERQLLQVSLGNLSLSGEIRMFGDKFIAPQIGELRQRQLIDIWIRHLALCANGYSEASFIVSRSKYKKNGVYPATSQQLKPVPADKAVEQLQMLAGHYDQGLVEPLPFMPEASRAFFDTYKDSDDYDQAIEKAISNYASDQPGSEGSDRHYARLFNFPDVFDDFFAHLATDIYTPITKYLDKVDI